LKAINPKSQVLSSRAAIPSSKLCALALLYLCLSVCLPTGPIGMSDLSEMLLLHSLPPNRSDSCDHELGMTDLPKMQLLPLSLPTGPIFAIKSLERSDVSEMQLLHYLFQPIRFLRSRVWDILICPKFSFFPLSSNGSDS
jgi:hypothetical protein